MLTLVLVLLTPVVAQPPWERFPQAACPAGYLAASVSCHALRYESSMAASITCDAPDPSAVAFPFYKEVRDHMGAGNAFGIHTAALNRHITTETPSDFGWIKHPNQDKWDGHAHYQNPCAQCVEFIGRTPIATNRVDGTSFAPRADALENSYYPNRKLNIVDPVKVHIVDQMTEGTVFAHEDFQRSLDLNMDLFAQIVQITRPEDLGNPTTVTEICGAVGSFPICFKHVPCGNEEGTTTTVGETTTTVGEPTTTTVDETTTTVGETTTTAGETTTTAGETTTTVVETTTTHAGNNDCGDALTCEIDGVSNSMTGNLCSACDSDASSCHSGAHTWNGVPQTWYNCVEQCQQYQDSSNWITRASTQHKQAFVDRWHLNCDVPGVVGTTTEAIATTTIDAVTTTILSGTTAEASTTSTTTVAGGTDCDVALTCNTDGVNNAMTTNLCAACGSDGSECHSGANTWNGVPQTWYDCIAKCEQYHDSLNWITKAETQAKQSFVDNWHHHCDVPGGRRLAAPTILV